LYSEEQQVLVKVTWKDAQQKAQKEWLPKVKRGSLTKDVKCSIGRRWVERIKKRKRKKV